MPPREYTTSAMRAATVAKRQGMFDAQKTQRAEVSQLRNRYAAGMIDRKALTQGIWNSSKTKVKAFAPLRAAWRTASKAWTSGQDQSGRPVGPIPKIAR